MKFLNAYLLIINALGFLFMFIDKENSIHRQWRIRERTLLTIAGIGGSLGVCTAMLLCRHKTKHRNFMIGVPCMLAVHCVIAVLLYIIF